MIPTVPCVRKVPFPSWAPDSRDLRDTRDRRDHRDRDLGTMLLENSLSLKLLTVRFLPQLYVKLNSYFEITNLNNFSFFITLAVLSMFAIFFSLLSCTKS